MKDKHLPQFEHVPEGFLVERVENRWARNLGDLYSIHGADTVCMGFVVKPEHCNSSGLLHGGAVATLCDMALARASRAPGYELPLSATVVLNIVYLSTGRIGEWLEVRAMKTKGGDSLAFATGEVVSGGRLIATAAGTFARPNSDNASK